MLTLDGIHGFGVKLGFTYQACPLLLHKVSNVQVVDTAKPGMRGILFIKNILLKTIDLRQYLPIIFVSYYKHTGDFTANYVVL